MDTPRTLHDTAAATPSKHRAGLAMLVLLAACAAQVPATAQSVPARAAQPIATAMRPALLRLPMLRRLTPIPAPAVATAAAAEWQGPPPSPDAPRLKIPRLPRAPHWTRGTLWHAEPERDTLVQLKLRGGGLRLTVDRQW